MSHGQGSSGASEGVDASTADDTGSAPPAPSTWREARAQARALRRARAQALATRPLASHAVPDPLARGRRTAASTLARVALTVLAALSAHGLVLGGFVFAHSMLGVSRGPDPRNVPIELVMVEPPPPPPVEPEPAPEVEPEPEAPPAPEPKAPPKKRRERKPKAAPPPPQDPIDARPEPPPKRQKEVRRIVGLSLQSTVKGGSGPSFAVGNTRMGATDDTAQDPNAVEEDSPNGGPRAAQTNRRASRLPIGLGGRTVEKPKFAGPRLEPTYPEDYRAQNLEAKITLEVTIGPDGRVTKARIVSGSPYEKFEAAALAMAKKQRWVSAKRGGEPIPYTLTYSYFFTLKD